MEITHTDLEILDDDKENTPTINIPKGTPPNPPIPSIHQYPQNPMYPYYHPHMHSNLNQWYDAHTPPPPPQSPYYNFVNTPGIIKNNPKKRTQEEANIVNSQPKKKKGTSAKSSNKNIDNSINEVVSQNINAGSTYLDLENIYFLFNIFKNIPSNDIIENYKTKFINSKRNDGAITSQIKKIKEKMLNILKNKGDVDDVEDDSFDVTEWLIRAATPIKENGTNESYLFFPKIKCGLENPESFYGSTNLVLTLSKTLNGDQCIDSDLSIKITVPTPIGLNDGIDIVEIDGKKGYKIPKTISVPKKNLSI
jgi:hypothetical protein